MASTVEYGTYIIDLSTAMLENPRGLTNAQGHRIIVIRRQAVNFLTDYMRHESSALPDLLSYLSKDAARPLSMLVNSCDMILNGSCGTVQQDYGEAITEIRDCAIAMYEDIEDMRQNLEQFMSNLGMV